MSRGNKKVIQSYLTQEEYKQIKDVSEQAGVSISTFIKKVCLQQEISSKIDKQAILNILKTNADLGRLGGLFKMALANNMSKNTEVEIRSTLRQIENTQRLISSSIEKIIKKIHEN